MAVQSYDHHGCTVMIIMAVHNYDYHDYGCAELWSSWLYIVMIITTVQSYDYHDYVSEDVLPALIYPHVPRPAAGGGWTGGRSGWMAGEWTPLPPCMTASWTVSAAPSGSRPCWSPDLTWAPANRQQSTHLCKGNGANCANLKGDGVNCANLIKRLSEMC